MVFYLLVLLFLQTFQHRRDGSVDFDRFWDDYKNGFGQATGEYWLGINQLEKVTRLYLCFYFEKANAPYSNWLIDWLHSVLRRIDK